MRRSGGDPLRHLGRVDAGVDLDQHVAGLHLLADLHGDRDDDARLLGADGHGRRAARLVGRLHDAGPGHRLAERRPRRLDRRRRLGRRLLRPHDVDDREDQHARRQDGDEKSAQIHFLMTSPLPDHGLPALADDSTRSMRPSLM